jgi:hypothetical protein
MRPIERIDNFLRKVSWKQLGERWSMDLHFLEKSQEYNTELYTNFLDYWVDNSDQRIGQALINLTLIPDNMKAWIDEESDILIDQGIAPEECLYWTSLYDKDNVILDEPITRLVKDMDVSHINRILEQIPNRLSENMKQAFQNVIKKG